MVEYNEHEIRIIDHFRSFNPKENSRATKYQQYLKTIPQEHKRYKCYDCFKILHNDELIDGKCPICNSKQMLVEMCPIDHNGCGHEITGTIVYCPICKEPVCPTCGDHNVTIISRVTGYLSNVEGWNNAKRAELRDRVRSDLNESGILVPAKANS